MEKQEPYNKLVEKRKACRLCANLTNPGDNTTTCWQFDSDHIGPWSRWQGNLDADILVVGQDWGDTAYWNKWQGRDEGSGNPTNENLQKLLSHIGVRVGKPREVQEQVAFFTNAILCLKEGGLQAPVSDQWFTNCSKTFFKPLVDIINPKVVLALGHKVSQAILAVYKVNYGKSTTLKTLMRQSPYRLNDATVLFPLYHCGAGGVNRNRSMPEQLEDWAKVARWLETR